MKNSKWKQVDSLPGEYTQLMLFPPTVQEILTARVNELEEKLERQRKGQFGKIGRSEKRLKDLEERFDWIEKAICHQDKIKANLGSENTCKILEMMLS